VQPTERMEAGRLDMLAGESLTSASTKPSQTFLAVFAAPDDLVGNPNPGLTLEGRDTGDLRRGSRRPEDVPTEVLELLETGRLETANLMEQIALDMEVTFNRLIPEAGGKVAGVNKVGLVARMRQIGAVLASLDHDVQVQASRSPSDTVRAWAAMSVGAQRGLTLESRLMRVRPFAMDPHFAVREWAWIAIRDELVRDPLEGLKVLTPWAKENDARLRRFATEATRPRGVWSRHIPLLKSRPELATELLSAVRHDPARYVRLSIGNWLNDAAKTRPQWVSALIEEWSVSPGLYHAEIKKRALRSVSRAY
jgi:3-methyladenine DNA glycosylase AlkC